MCGCHGLQSIERVAIVFSAGIDLPVSWLIAVLAWKRYICPVGSILLETYHPA